MMIKKYLVLPYSEPTYKMANESAQTPHTQIDRSNTYFLQTEIGNS